MDEIGVYINNQKEDSLNMAKAAIELIKERGFEPVFLSRQIGDDILEDIRRLPIDEFFSQTSSIAVFGGDGTLLSVARRAAPYGTPLFGINAGKLGFLTEGELSDLEDIIDRLLTGDIVSDDRMMLECKVFLSGGREEEFIALNDVVIKNTAMRLMHITVEVAGTVLERFRSDGLIVSTPTGSTAYSLAAGGPIVDPGASVFIVNPICPQHLYDRPFILPDNLTIRVSFEKDEHEILASIDGQDNFYLNGSDYLEIKASNFKAKLLRLSDSSYYDRIRSKLHDIK